MVDAQPVPPPPPPVASVPQVTMPSPSVSKLQFARLFIRNPPPVILRPPEMVEVAMVEVAKKEANTGVLEARRVDVPTPLPTITPKEGVEEAII